MNKKFKIKDKYINKILLQVSLLDEEISYTTNELDTNEVAILYRTLKYLTKKFEKEFEKEFENE